MRDIVQTWDSRHQSEVVSSSSPHIQQMWLIIPSPFSHQIHFSHYFVFQNPPYYKLWWWLCLYPPKTHKQILLFCLSIFFKISICRFGQYTVISQSFQTQQSSLSSLIFLVSKRYINHCSWFFFHSNKFLLHSNFQDHSRLTVISPPCQR